MEGMRCSVSIPKGGIKKKKPNSVCIKLMETVACICHTEKACVKVTNVTATWSNPMVPPSYSVQLTTPFFLIILSLQHFQNTPLHSF